MHVIWIHLSLWEPEWATVTLKKKLFWGNIIMVVYACAYIALVNLVHLLFCGLHLTVKCKI